MVLKCSISDVEYQNAALRVRDSMIKVLDNWTDREGKEVCSHFASDISNRLFDAALEALKEDE
jgi:hypothetical protein